MKVIIKKIIIMNKLVLEKLNGENIVGVIPINPKGLDMKFANTRWFISIVFKFDFISSYMSCNSCYAYLFDL